MSNPKNTALAMWGFIVNSLTRRQNECKCQYEESTNEGERDMSRTIKAIKEAAIDEAITRRESQMTYDNEAIVRNAYHTAEGNVLDVPGWIGSFTEDGVFNNVSGKASYRGEHLKNVLITFAFKKESKVNRTAGKVSNQMAGYDRLPILRFARERLAFIFILR